MPATKLTVDSLLPVCPGEAPTLAVLPIPSCPCVLRPQQATRPLSSRAHVCAPPAATATAALPVKASRSVQPMRSQDYLSPRVLTCQAVSNSFTTRKPRAGRLVISLLEIATHIWSRYTIDPPCGIKPPKVIHRLIEGRMNGA
jgi:hypothetical protein